MTATPTWDQTLDDLEAHLDQVSALLSPSTDDASDLVVVADQAPWEPPTGLGPLPERLATRAQDLLERQDATHTRLTASMTALRNQQHVASRVSDATSPEQARPVYLDLDA